MKGIALISGNAHPDLAHKIAHHLGIDLSKAFVGKFSNGESNVNIEESVREKDVYIVQPTVHNPNDSLIELLIMVDAIKRGSPYRITAVVPCFGYARQDRKDKSRAPISGKLIANMMEVAGVNRILTVDLHTTQMQGFFNIPVDNLLADNYLFSYIQNYIPGEKVVVSPGVGGTIRAKRVADCIDCPLAIIHFGRIIPGATKEEVAIELKDMKLVGDVKGKTAILISDLADTLQVEVLMAETLIQQGASQVYAVVTHGIPSDEAAERLEKCPYLTELVMTNTVAHADKQKITKKMEVIDVSPLIAECIRRTHFGDSISVVFKQEVAKLMIVKPNSQTTPASPYKTRV